MPRTIKKKRHLHDPDTIDITTYHLKHMLLEHLYDPPLKYAEKLLNDLLNQNSILTGTMPNTTGIRYKNMEFRDRDARYTAYYTKDLHPSLTSKMDEYVELDKETREEKTKSLRALAVLFSTCSSPEDLEELLGSSLYRVVRSNVESLTRFRVSPNWSPAEKQEFIRNFGKDLEKMQKRELDNLISRDKFT